MCKKTTRELKRGGRAALKLVKHLFKMGAANCTIPIKYKNYEFEVFVKLIGGESKIGIKNK